MDADKAFVWFVYLSLAVALALMATTLLPADVISDEEPTTTPTQPNASDDPDGDADDGSNGTDAATDGAGGADETNTSDGTADTADGANASDGTTDGTAVQNETEDPVTVLVPVNETNATAANGTREPADVERVEQLVIQHVNDIRAEAYIAALDSIYLDDIWTIAERLTTAMVEGDFFALETPAGEDTRDRYRDVDPNCQRIDNYKFAFEGIARQRYSPWTNTSIHLTEEELARRLVANYTDASEYRKKVYNDIGVDVRYDNDTDYVVSTLTMC